MALIVAIFLLKSFVIHILTTDPKIRRRRFSLNVHNSSKKCLSALNVELKVNHSLPLDRCFLIVSNHLGYLDIFALASSTPTLFVTSIEMKETPFLGLLTEMAGCTYVERRSRDNIKNEIKDIAATLNEGFNVVIFPEGRSTNGEKVQPFKKSLLMACAESEANIMPAVANFRFINGEPMQDKFRDWVCWYDDMAFVSSVWNASQIKHCLLTLDFLDEIKVNSNSDHREIASLAQTQIESKYIPITK